MQVSFPWNTVIVRYPKTHIWSSPIALMSNCGYPVVFGWVNSPKTSPLAVLLPTVSYFTADLWFDGKSWPVAFSWYSVIPFLKFPASSAPYICSPMPLALRWLLLFLLKPVSLLQACGPGVQQHCDKNLYMSGICYLLDAKLRNLQNITTGYQSKNMSFLRQSCPWVWNMHSSAGRDPVFCPNPGDLPFKL